MLKPETIELLQWFKKQKKHWPEFNLTKNVRLVQRQETAVSKTEQGRFESDNEHQHKKARLVQRQRQQT